MAKKDDASPTLRRTPTQRRGSGAETRNKLLISARHLAGTRSVADITVEAITHGADVSRAAFYMYFENKSDICHEVAQNAQLAFRGRAADFTVHDDLRETIVDGTRAFVLGFRHDRPGMRMLYDLSYGEQSIRRLVHELRAETYARWTGILGDAVAAGTARQLDDVPGVTRLLCGMMETFCVRSMRTTEYRGTRMDAPRGAAQVADLWWRAVAP
ncbi:TetR/AcrR family transcriptional regulator [Microbacterium sp. No. 7]|uniref:TetR/AcrR family transcriptional regulator n=1 Tax=Microbacterium sp. No. 7 TaxID=1714373 RepID=UPI0006D2A7C6|nr:TetR/AcrR family transcriptional regulator [Microbacterium sp. No. 7]